ncbi:MAG: hypothetical protein IPK68_09250 [Bdellovibrionales bacterium]|nr:hypothetical protein [Bdellovibrionales bacterium]
MLAIGFTANAEQKKTVETVITCQQDDGDQWVEAGIALNDGPGLRALVVQHNVDDDSSKLVCKSSGVFQKAGKKRTIYQDSNETIRLVVEKKNGRIVGSLSVLQDGPGGFSQSGLDCYEKSDISFEK